jgi:carbon-monoxide dehydrogenase medium subunit
VNVPSFTHLQPADLREASALLSRYGRDAKILAGGTDVIVKMKHRRMTPPYLVNIKGIPGLDYVEYESGKGLRVGALATIESVKASMPVRKLYPVLHKAAAYMATVAVRNRATLVGNICNGSPSAETGPALIVLGAEVRILGPAGERTVAVQDFFVGPGETVLRPDEIVVEVSVPEPVPGSAAAYEKYSLRRMDVALVGVAALVVPSNGVLEEVRVALSAVAPTPIRAKGAEAILLGQAPTAALIVEAARAAAAASRPITDIRAGAEARRVWVETLTDQVVRQALKAAKMGVV